MRISFQRLVEPRLLSGYALPAIVITFGLQTIRVFMPSLAWYLKDTVGLPSTSLGVYALSTFAVGLLAAVLWRLAGPRLSLWTTAGGVALIRVLEQLIVSPAADLYLSMVGTALFVLFLPVWMGHVRAQKGLEGAPRWAYGLWLGLSLDTVIKGAAGTLDLSWIGGVLPLALTLAFVLALVYFLLSEPYSLGRPVSEAGWRSAAPLAGLGPFLLIQALIFQNIGWVAEVSGLQTPAAFLMVSLANLAGVLGVTWGLSRPYTFRFLLGLVVVIYLGVAVASADHPGLGFLATLFIGQFLMGWAWSLIAIVSATGSRGGLWPSTISLGVGMLLFVLLAFVYYAALDISLGISRSAIAPTAAVLFSLAALGSLPMVRAHGRTPWSDRSGVAACLAMLVIPMAYMATHGQPVASVPPAGYPIKVMTYNLHSAYSYEGRQDLEAIAQNIAASGADVVALQEVSRGWLIDGSTDMADWLARRLDMNVLFKGTSDPVWGNAILTRYPIQASGSGDLPKTRALIGRGYLWARLNVGGPSPLLVIATHLHQIAADHDIRLVEVPVLIDFWHDQPYTLIMGDMNAEPQDPEIDLYRQAGLTSAWEEAGHGDGYTFSSGNPYQKIDWIWHTPDLRAVDPTVMATTASDHRPLVTSLDLAH